MSPVSFARTSPKACRHKAGSKAVATRKHHSGAARRFAVRAKAQGTSTKFAKLGFLSQVTAIYRIPTAVRDLRLAKVASLLSTYHARGDVMARIEETLTRNRGERDTGLQTPADSWTQAMAFHTALAQETAFDTVAGMLRRKKDRGTRADGAATPAASSEEASRTMTSRPAP